MTPSRADLAKRREAIRAEVAARVAKLRAAVPPKAGSRRRRWALLALLLLLLCFLRLCPKPEPPSPPPPPPAPRSTPGEKAPSEVVLPAVKVRRADRPAWAPEDPGPLPWVEALQVQVAARGPRLAACFEGVPRPGAVRWTALLEPLSGRVSDATLEPHLSTDDLTRDQRTCVLDVLANPTYHLASSGQERSTPVKVGLMVEF